MNGRRRCSVNAVVSWSQLWWIQTILRRNIALKSRYRLNLQAQRNGRVSWRLRWVGVSRRSDAGDPGVIRVPTGSVLKGIDEPCGVEAVRNVFQPLSVYLAAMECQIKVLALLKPLIQIVRQLPSPSADALAQFTASALALEPCLLTITPASTLPFLRDLLCITLQSLQCLLDEPVSQSEKAAAIDSIQRVLDAAEPYLNAAGIAPVILSTTGSVAGLTQDIASLRIATDALGGCGR